MAIAHDADSNASGSDNTAVTSLTWSHTCTGSDLVLLVILTMKDTTDTDRVLTGITYNGVAMTQLVRQDQSTRNDTCELWGLIAPDTGAHNIVASLSGGSCSQVSGGAVSLTGCDQTAPFEVTAGLNVENDSTPDITITPLTANAWVVDGFIYTTLTGTPVVDASQTQVFMYGVPALTYNGMSYKGPVSASLQTMTWNSSGSNLDDWNRVAVSVKPASGGGGGATHPGWVGKGAWFFEALQRFKDWMRGNFPVLVPQIACSAVRRAAIARGLSWLHDSLTVHTGRASIRARSAIAEQNLGIRHNDARLLDQSRRAGMPRRVLAVPSGHSAQDTPNSINRQLWNPFDVSRVRVA